MSDALIIVYPWVKAVHVMAVITWMAGLFYLPRLFVHHVESGHDEIFRGMEEKLLRVIMNPSMVGAWGTGLLLAMTPGVVEFSSIWPWMKLGGISTMTGFHVWCAAERKRLVAGVKHSGRTYRIINEVPTLLMVVIVLAVIVKF